MPHVPWTLIAQDFRGLGQVSWSPSGVCLLSGANGAGKTSVLNALEFLQTALDRGVHEAVRVAGGGAYLRRLGAASKAPVRLSVALGELTWAIELLVEGGGIHPNHGETVQRGVEILARRDVYAMEVSLATQKAGKTTWFNPTTKAVSVRNPSGAQFPMLTFPPGASREMSSTLDASIASEAPGLIKGERWAADGRSLPQMLWDKRRPEELPPELKAMMDVVRGIRVHGAYRLDSIREPQSVGEVSSRLHADGRNVWAVLQSWKAAPRKYNDQFRWVIDGLRAAFPELVVDLELETFGQTVGGRFYPPDARSVDASLPLYVAADGLLVGILHLTAVAGAPEGSVLAFDEVENQLHPHAIRAILKAMRARAEERDLTIILTTHSPVVMNEFKGHEDQFYVLDHGHATVPVPLDDARDPDWLAHFSLGDLYDREDFAAQSPAAKPKNAAE
jgi:predicted ATPase